MFFSPPPLSLPLSFFLSHFDHVLAEVVVCAVGWVVTLPAMEMTAQATALLVLVPSTSTEEKSPAHYAVKRFFQVMHTASVTSSYHVTLLALNFYCIIVVNSLWLRCCNFFFSAEAVSELYRVLSNKIVQ